MESETDSSVTPVSELLRASGYWNPDWDAVAELDPIWTEKFMARGMHPVTAGVLEPKVLKRLLYASVRICTRAVISGGATKEEIAAVLQVVSVLGLHTRSLGVPLLLEEVAAIERDGTAGNRAAA